MALDLTMVRGKAMEFDVAVTQADQVTPFDLTGAVLYFHALFKDYATGISVAIDKDSSLSPGGIIITDAPGGLAVLQIDSSDTANLPTVVAGAGKCIGGCELVVDDGSGIGPVPVDSGQLTVTTNVGTP